MSTIPHKKGKHASRIMGAPASSADVQLRDPLLYEQQVADLLGVKKETLTVWRATRRYPLRYTKIGRFVRYRLSDVEAFLDARTHNGDGSDERKRAVS